MFWVQRETKCTRPDRGVNQGDCLFAEIFTLTSAAFSP